ncbi:MAG: hypothetical protein KatS3mg068_1382 [Candidatus Sericytochromatia bacterium]|nr:MAG: hypothetical protein KatS3mg068_1382 [Candidatus Sericytochromatia bacterium]
MTNNISFNVFSNLGYTSNNPYQEPINKSQLDAQNSILRISDEKFNLNINLPHLQADLIDRTPNDPLNFKDVASFDMNIKNGILSLKDAELSSLVKNLLKKETDLIKDINFNFQPGNNAEVNLQVKKVLKFNIKINGKLSAQPVNNMVRFTPNKISVNKIPIQGLLKLFKLEIGELVKVGNPNGSFFTSGDSIYFGPTKFVENPKINGEIHDVRTGLGTISILLGKDSANYQNTPLYGSNNYLRLRGGNVDFNGFNLQDADVALLDGTPNDPFDIENDPSQKVISKGRVAIPEEFIATALKQKAGSGSLKNMQFTMPNGVGKLKASMWGFLPISLNLHFSKSSTGELKVTPAKGRVLGFIPLPNSLLRDTLKKETEGKIDGNGVTVDLGKLADLQTPNGIKNVETNNGQLILYM